MFKPSLSRRSFLQGAAVAAAGITAGHAAFAAHPPLFFDPLSRPMGLQLYTLGDQPAEDLDAVFARVAAIGYRDIELPGLYGHDAAEIRAAAQRAGLVISGIQLSASPGLDGAPLTLLSDIQEIVDTLGLLGVAQVVMPLAPLPAGFRPPQGGKDEFLQAMARAYVEAGEDIWKQTAVLLNDRASALKPHGIALGYHNHNIEFAPIGSTTGWEILAGETDPDLIRFEVDTAWLAAAGIDPADFLRRHSGRVHWLHIKDLLATTPVNHALSMDPVEVGNGRLDWVQILSAAHSAGAKHFYVEQEPPFAIPRLEAITRSYQYLSRLRVPLP